MDEWVVPIIVAFISPFFIYLAAIRKLSGRINTSEATDLWREAGVIREEYRRRAEYCEEQLKVSKNEIAVVVARNTVLSRANRKLRQELRDALDRTP